MEYTIGPTTYKEHSGGPQIDQTLNVLINNFPYLSSLPGAVKPTRDGSLGGFFNYMSSFCRVKGHLNVVGKEQVFLQRFPRRAKEHILSTHYSSASIQPSVLAVHALLPGISYHKNNSD